MALNVLFAVMGASTQILVIESVAAVAFVVVAAAYLGWLLASKKVRAYASQ
jgi:hypothetical protein